MSDAVNTSAPQREDNIDPTRYNPAEIEPRWQALWDADPAL